MKAPLTGSILSVLLVTALSLPARAADEHAHHHSGHDHTRPDSHAPIGVMGDHLMREGEIMLSYRYMNMDMEGNRTGTERVDVPLTGYMVSPTSMVMDMHMLGAMYAPSDRLTLAVMLPFTSISMDHIRNMDGLAFTTESSGIGDVKLAAQYGLYARPGRDLIFNFAISAPTGSIDETDDTPMMADAHLPYPMQLGSGTWDIIPGLTWVQLYDSWSWGAQGLYTLRTGTNDNGYTLGNKLNLSAWVAKKIAQSTSLSFRLNGLDWDNIDGTDNKLVLMPGMVPTADPNLRGGTRVDALVGINFVTPDLKSLRLAAEAGAPVYQDLDGPQLETDLVFTLGAQYTF